MCIQAKQKKKKKKTYTQTEHKHRRTDEPLRVAKCGADAYDATDNLATVLPSCYSYMCIFFPMFTPL